MHKLTIDFETRSNRSVTDDGPWKYSTNPYTEVICLSVKWNGMPSTLWLPDKFEEYRTTEAKCSKELIVCLLRNATIIEAHNVEFEVAIWENIMVKLFGFPPLPKDKLRCSAAKAAVFGIPRALEKACKVMNTAVQKDKEGSLVMKQIAQPRKAKKAEVKQLKEAGYEATDKTNKCWKAPDGTIQYLWIKDPEKFTILFSYCLQDTDAEHSLSETLPDLTERALEVWRLDQEINRRGVHVDIFGCHAMINLADLYKAELNEEIVTLTDGEVTKGTQVKQIKEWMVTQGHVVTELDKEAINVLLEDARLSDKVKRVLKCRQLYAKSSVAKYTAMLKRMEDDKRVRSLLMFNGAHTGRWAGKAIQLQNLPSRDLIDSPELALEYIKKGLSLEFIKFIWESPLKVASSCIRPVFQAEPDKEFIVVDYSSVEGRGLAWLAGEQYVLDAYIAGKCAYKTAAAGVFNMNYDDITKESSERKVGKVIELACGYQGYIGAFRQMEASMGMDVGMSDDEVKESINDWRKARPLTVRLWKQIQAAAEIALTLPGAVGTYNGIRFQYDGTHLKVRIPSGRILYYPFAGMHDGETPWGKPIKVITYHTTDAQTKQWKQVETYGGKLTENLIQAICADILWEALVRLDKAGFPIVLHVHDEIVAEVTKGTRSLDEYMKIMCEVPTWATGFPIDATGFIGKYYKK